MIHIALYNQPDLYDLNFVQNQDKFSTLIIVPSPLKADALRSKFTGVIPEIITISRFIKDLLKLHFPEQEIQIKRKSELILVASSLWKNHCEQENKPFIYDVFMKGFNLFTELRGYSLDLELIRPILTEYSEEIEKFIIFFYQISEQLNLVDEHRAYKILADLYRQIGFHDITEQKNLIFWDFVFVAGSQIDFLNALATKHDLYIPFPKSIYEESRDYDWIRWLKPQEAENKKNEVKKLELPTYYFSPKKLNQIIKNVEHNNAYFIFTTNNLDSLNFFDMSLSDVFFKLPAEIFQGEVSFFSKILNELFVKDESLSIDVVGKKLAEIIHTEFQSKDKDFKRIKIASEYLKTLKSYYEISIKNANLNINDIKVINAVILLNLPRANLFPLSDDEFHCHLVDLRSIQSIPDKAKVYICASSEFGSIKPAEEIYPEKVFKILSTLGPVKRNALQFYFIQNYLKELVANQDVTLLLENGLKDHDLGWAELLEQYNLNVKNQISKTSDFKIINSLKIKQVPHQLNSLSAHKLQSYIDCPQKYYYSYVEKIKIDLQLESMLQKNELGVLEHKCIEEYFKQYNDFNEDALSLVVKNVLTGYLKNNQINLTNLDYLKALEEINHFSSNGIKALLELKKNIPEAQFKFEYSISEVIDGLKIEASVDCVVTFDDGFAILDFKRSEGSIPTQKAFLLHQKVQVHFYIKYLKKRFENLKFFGYVNLESPEKSLIFPVEETYTEIIKNHSLFTSKSTKKLPVELETLESDFDQFYQSKVELLKRENEFKPIPLNAKVCQFCDVFLICDRGRA
jgi:hypothetical protein